MVKLTFVDEPCSGVLDSQGEFHIKRGFGRGTYVAVLARDKKRLVGAMRAIWAVTPGQLQACGTWVAPTFRRAGLGGRLWERMLRETKPRSVWVKTISANGKRLVRALKRRYPKIRWEWKQA